MKICNDYLDFRAKNSNQNQSLPRLACIFQWDFNNDIFNFQLNAQHLCDVDKQKAVKRQAMQ